MVRVLDKTKREQRNLEIFCSIIRGLTVAEAARHHMVTTGLAREILFDHLFLMVEFSRKRHPNRPPSHFDFGDTVKDVYKNRQRILEFLDEYEKTSQA